MRPYRPRGITPAPSLANINADTIRRAEEAVSKLASQYREWVRGDLTKLRDTLVAAKAGGAARDAAYEQVRHVAHDLRGQGSTFGYPLVTRIAQSISHTLKGRAADADNDADLAAHVEAIAAVIEQDISDEGSDPAAHIIETLQRAIGRTVV
jgi:hypothetical protein